MLRARCCFDELMWCTQAARKQFSQCEADQSKALEDAAALEKAFFEKVSKQQQTERQTNHSQQIEKKITSEIDECDR